MLAGSILDPILNGLASDAVKAVASAIATAAGDLLKAIFSAISGATRVTPEASWFSGGPHSPVGLVAGIGGVVLVLLFLLQIARSLLRREAGGLARAVTGVVKATWGTAVFLSLLTSALVVTDDLARYVIAGAGGSISTVAGTLLSASVLTSLASADPMAVVIVGLLMIVGALVLYATLLVRSVAIYAVAMAGPVVLAGQVYDSSGAWLRRWLEVLLALVVSKLAIVLLFVLGMAMLHGATGITALLGGTIVVALASFSPLLVYKLFHFVGLEAGAIVHEGIHRPGPTPIGQTYSAMSQLDRVRSLLAPMSAAAGSAAGGLAATAAGAGGMQRNHSGGSKSTGSSASPGSGASGPKGPDDQSGPDQGPRRRPRSPRPLPEGPTSAPAAPPTSSGGPRSPRSEPPPPSTPRPGPVGDVAARPRGTLPDEPEEEDEP